MKRLLIIMSAIFICIFQAQVWATEQETEKATEESSIQAEYDSPETIKKVQEALNAAGYDCGTADGIAGEKTKEAVIRYKTDHEMDETTSVINYDFLIELGVLEKPVPLTEGPVFDGAMEIDSELVLSTTSDSLSLERTYEEDSRENIQLFLYDVCKMIGVLADDGTYSSMMCSYWSDKSIFMLNISEIEDRVKFKTFTPGATSKDKDANTYWTAYYILTFCAHDSSMVFEKELEDLKKDNGMEYKIPDNYRNGYYWALTCFGISAETNLSDDVLTVKMKASNTIEDGWNVGKTMDDAIGFFNEICHADPDSMPHDQLSVTYTDSVSGETLYILVADHVSNGWQTSKCTVYGDLFSKGLVGYQEGKSLDDIKHEEEEAAKQAAESVKAETESTQISDKEILFRGIPWGTKASEVDKILGEEGVDLLATHYGSLGDPNTLYNMRSSGVLDYTSGIEDLRIDGGGERGWFREMELAGYTPSDVYTFYMYPIEDGKLIRSKEDAEFYFGYYVFRPGDFSDYNAIYDDLKSKLISLYGGGTEKDAYSGVVTTWVDKDGNMVALSYEQDYDYISLGYIMGGADDRLLGIKSILDEEALEEENLKRNENTNNNNGL